MKIVSWNCESGFFSKSKYNKIRELDADIYVILEFNAPAQTDEKYEEFIKNKITLMYDNEDKTGWNRGIAVIAKEGIELKDNNWVYEHNDFLSVRVNDSFDLVAVWTHDNIKVDGKWKDKGNNEYIRRIEEYLKLYENKLVNSDNLVMCGDFNLDMALDNKKNKNCFIKMLKSYGYESIYHKQFNEEIGEETTKTFFNKDGNFHIDYLFSKPEIISSFNVGDKEEYVDSKFSDHVPLIFEVDIMVI